MQGIKKSLLFAEMTQEDIDKCLGCAGAKQIKYNKEEILFTPLDEPQKLYILLEGSITIFKDSASGKRSIITTVEEPGEVFGEVYLFLRKQYDYYAVATKPSVILEMPKHFFYYTCPSGCQFHQKLIYNMLSILANKAYYMNQKLQVLSGGSIRKKITKYLLEQVGDQNQVYLKMTREELADFLHIARPSLSRELTKMKEEGLLEAKGKKITLLDIEALELE
jgi:CRP-like cAMP-binding protein